MDLLEAVIILDVLEQTDVDIVIEISDTKSLALGKEPSQHAFILLRASTRLVLAPDLEGS